MYIWVGCAPRNLSGAIFMRWLMNDAQRVRHWAITFWPMRMVPCNTSTVLGKLTVLHRGRLTILYDTPQCHCRAPFLWQHELVGTTAGRPSTPSPETAFAPVPCRCRTYMGGCTLGSAWMRVVSTYCTVREKGRTDYTQYSTWHKTATLVHQLTS